jgi:hypothetical protein
MWGTEVKSIAPRVLNHGTRWKCVVSFTSRRFYPRFSLYRKLGGPQNQSGGGGDGKSPFFAPDDNQKLVV